MVLESCMILLDNSEYMRNGDYVPTRMEAQHDAANFLVGAVTQSNPENTVGVIAVCGSEPGASGELLVSPTDDMGKILGALHGVPIRTSANSLPSFQQQNSKAGTKKKGATAALATEPLIVSLQVANLALKHRRNKNGAQRVVAFVGSPLKCDGRALAKAGRMLKKNGLAVDVVAIGELEENEPKLRELVDAANGGASSANNAGGESSNNDGGGEIGSSSRLVTVPPGVLPSDVLVGSPIVGGGGGGGSAGVGAGDAPGGGGGGGNAGDFGGVDPNMDPELAMALRVSMEEERARQERMAAAATEGGSDANGSEAVPAAGTTPEDVSDEEALLQQALAMSMATSEEEEMAAAVAASGGGPTTMEEDVDEEDEDAAMRLALQMSMQPDNDSGNDKEEADPAEKKQKTETTPKDDAATVATSSTTFQDPQFVNQLLGTLPGVDTNNPELQDAIKNIMDNKPKATEDKKGDDAANKDGKKDEE